MKEIKEQISKKTIIRDENPYSYKAESMQGLGVKIDRYAYDKLTSDNSYSKSKDILLGTLLALFINMLAKGFGSWIDPSIVFEMWEVYAFLISLGLFCGVWTFDRFSTSPSKKVKEEIGKLLKLK